MLQIALWIFLSLGNFCKKVRPMAIDSEALKLESRNTNTFTVPIVDNSNYVFDAARAVKKVRNKYSPHFTTDGQIKRNYTQGSGQTQGTVNAQPTAEQASFICPVTIGGQTLYLDFDTGSSDLWVQSDLQDIANRNGQPYFVFENSSTYVSDPSCKWQILYGDGSGARGVCGTDVVQIGGVNFSEQVVELATEMDGNFDFSGLLGLGFHDINTVSPTQAKTFFENVVPTLESPLFAVNLNPATPMNRSYDFGYVDDNKFNGLLSYVDIYPPDDGCNDSPNPGFWMFNSSSYKFGDGAAVPYSNGAINVIADTGTTLVYMTDDIVLPYYENIVGATYDITHGLWIYPCDQKSSVQNISISAGHDDKWITFTVDALDNGPVSSTYCILGLQASNGLGINIIGDTMEIDVMNSFYKSNYVVHKNATDGLQAQVGWAPFA